MPVFNRSVRSNKPKRDGTIHTWSVCLNGNVEPIQILRTFTNEEDAYRYYKTCWDLMERHVIDRKYDDVLIVKDLWEEDYTNTGNGYEKF